MSGWVGGWGGVTVRPLLRLSSPPPWDSLLICSCEMAGSFSGLFQRKLPPPPCSCRHRVSVGGGEFRMFLWGHLGWTTSSVSCLCSSLKCGVRFLLQGMQLMEQSGACSRSIGGKEEIFPARDCLCKSPIIWHWGVFVSQLITGKQLKLDSALC